MNGDTTYNSDETAFELNGGDDAAHGGGGSVTFGNWKISSDEYLWDNDDINK